ncbi:MAG: phosphate ABC transporter permease PstA [Anaerolineae bacterium]|nr:phosphate ABC transporter permease PstA [Anaerolineae bacterium]MDQ7034916.1 phosphate ABC transporter permease PstA [Anaerolineae bacterium]
MSRKSTVNFSNNVDLNQKLAKRRWKSQVGRFFFRMTLIASLLALLMLAYNILNRAFTTVAIEDTVNPTELSEIPLAELEKAELLLILGDYLSSNQLRILIFERILGAPREDWSDLNTQTLSAIIEVGQYPEDWGTMLVSELEPQQILALLGQGLSQELLVSIVEEKVVEERVVQVWTLTETVFNWQGIEAQVATLYPTTRLEFRFWLNTDFLMTAMHSQPELSGLRTAILGSLWLMTITAAFAFPVGVSAALYLEEYAADTPMNRIIQLNIANLAGVPSIIYGILGLIVFVRAMGFLTNGRTILSAGLTLGLLILPIIIISTQEAIRAVPTSLRQASYGMGATRWQMIYTVLFPKALPGILTGTILSLSRAFGETAPLIVVGSITRITADPQGPLSRFTAIPIQIYTWTAQPQDAFRSAAAAAILVLVVTLLVFNSVAIILRNRYS